MYDINKFQWLFHEGGSRWKEKLLGNTFLLIFFEGPFDSCYILFRMEIK